MEGLIQHSGLFDRVGNAYALSRNISYLEEGRYKQAGKLVGWSLLHGGPGIHSLAEECVALLRGELPSILSWIPYLVDERASSMVAKVICNVREPNIWLVS